MPRIMRMPIHQCNENARMLSVAGLFGFTAYLLACRDAALRIWPDCPKVRITSKF